MVALGERAEQIVTLAGGLIFDRAAAGWDVGVYLEDECDQRPLRVLGATHLPRLNGKPRLSDCGPEWPDVVVVAASLYARDRSVRRYISAVRSGNRQAQIAFYGGDAGATGALGQAGDVDHHLSAAAQAFKGRALSCFRSLRGTPVTPTETFSTAMSSSKVQPCVLVGSADTWQHNSPHPASL